MHSSLTSQDNIHFSTSLVCVCVLLRKEHDVYLVTKQQDSQGRKAFMWEPLHASSKQFFNNFLYLSNDINISAVLHWWIGRFDIKLMEKKKNWVELEDDYKTHSGTVDWPERIIRNNEPSTLVIWRLTTQWKSITALSTLSLETARHRLIYYSHNHPAWHDSRLSVTGWWLTARAVLMQMSLWSGLVACGEFPSRRTEISWARPLYKTIRFTVASFFFHVDLPL